MTTLNVRIPDTIGERLAFLATKTGRTKTYYVRAALEEKLTELEDYFFAMQALENVKTGHSRVWTQEEIEQGHDLED